MTHWGWMCGGRGHLASSESAKLPKSISVSRLASHEPACGAVCATASSTLAETRVVSAPQWSGPSVLSGPVPARGRLLTPAGSTCENWQCDARAAVNGLGAGDLGGISLSPGNFAQVARIHPAVAAGEPNLEQLLDALEELRVLAG